MPNRTEWEIVDDAPGSESRSRPSWYVLTGSRWKLACMVALGAMVLAGFAILAGVVALAFSLIGMVALGMVRLKLALRRYGVPPWQKRGLTEPLHVSPLNVQARKNDI